MTKFRPLFLKITLQRSLEITITFYRILQRCFLSRYSTLLNMQIIQHVTSHCIMTFEKDYLFKSCQTIVHKRGGLVIDHSLLTYTSTVSVSSIVLLLHKKQSQTLIMRCDVCISYNVEYLDKKRSNKNCTKNVMFKCCYNAIEKILDKKCHKHFNIE